MCSIWSQILGGLKMRAWLEMELLAVSQCSSSCRLRLKRLVRFHSDFMLVSLKEVSPQYYFLTVSFLPLWGLSKLARPSLWASLTFALSHMSVYEWATAVQSEAFTTQVLENKCSPLYTLQTQAPAAGLSLHTHTHMNTKPTVPWMLLHKHIFSCLSHKVLKSIGDYNCTLTFF